MAKLNKRLQDQTKSASASTFEPVDPGVYHLRLRDVNTDGNGPKGPYWSWEFESVEPGTAGRRFWNNTSLSESAAFKMKETYEAFGADLDADTDDLCGQIVKARISIRTIQAGPRKGELTNQIDRLEPKDPDFVPEEAAEGAGDKEESIF
jgi:hypothetical protein